MLREEGVEVLPVWPEAPRPAGRRWPGSARWFHIRRPVGLGVTTDAVVEFAVTGAVTGITAAVKRYRAMVSARARIWVDGEEVTITEDEPTIRIVEDEGP